MWSRFLQLFILVFWLGTVGLLIRKHTLPPEEGMTPVDLHEPMEAFFSSNSSTLLLVSEQGKRIGQATLSGSHRPQDPLSLRDLSVTGSLESASDGSPKGRTGAFWRGHLSFSQDYEPKAGQLLIRLPGQDVSVIFSYDVDQGGLGTDVISGGQTLFRSRPGIEVAPDVATPWFPLVSAWTQGLKSSLADGSTPPVGQPSARRGIIVVGNQKLPAYLIRLPLPADQWIKIYLSQAGEPLQAETSFGIDVSSEPFAAPTEK